MINKVFDEIILQNFQWFTIGLEKYIRYFSKEIFGITEHFHNTQTK